MSKLACPICGSQTVVKNGFIHNGKQNHKCKVCGHQFVEDPQQNRIAQQTKTLIDKLLLEKIPLAGIARVCDVSESWLQGYVNQKYAAVPQSVRETSNGSGLRLMWSLVRLSAFMWVNALSMVPKSCGIRCQEFIASVRLPTAISGMLMAVFFRRNVTKPWVRRREKRAISSVSTAQCGKESLA